jgi:class 3 adenylate cyclase
MQNEAQDLVWLEAHNGEKILVAQSCVLGRSRECQIVIEDERASRRHAMVHRQGDAEFWLVDLGSANGTRLNGRRLNRPARLRGGDRVEIAGRVFTFNQPGTASLEAASERASTINATISELRQLDCWLLVADMVGSTQLVQRLPAEASVSLTGRWLATCRSLVEASGGLINKYLGDGFLAYWSATESAKVADMVNALRKLQNEGEVPFRMVLHYGTATSGGAPSAGEESLSGKDVTFVFRMEELASLQGSAVFISEAAARKLGPLLPTVPQGTHSVNGFGGEHQFFALPTP